MPFHQRRRPCGSSSSRRGPRSVRNFRWGRRRPGGRRVFGAVISMPKDTSTRARTGPRSPGYYSSRASASRSGPARRCLTHRVDAIPRRARRLARVDIRRHAVLDLHRVRAAAEGPRRASGAVPIRAAPHLRFRGGRLGAVKPGEHSPAQSGRVSLLALPYLPGAQGFARRRGTNTPARRPSAIVL